MHEDQPAVRALLPAEAARQAGQEFELGGLLNVRVQYRRAPLSCLGTLLCLLSGLGLLAALGSDAWVLVGPAGAVFAAACVVNVIGRRKRTVKGWLARYQDGFAQLLLPGDLRAVRWPGVTKVGVIFRNVQAGGTMFVPPSTRTVVSAFYARPCLTQLEPLITANRVARGEAAALVADALRAVGPRLTAALIAAYDAGEPAVFGQVRIDRSGITLPARQGRSGSPADLVPWSAISSVNGESIVLPGRRNLVHAINLRCASKPKRRRIGLSKIPNGIFLPAVLRHAAARRGIPTRL
jgi:hypothetical protein